MQTVTAGEGGLDEHISILHRLTVQPVDYTDDDFHKDFFGAGTWTSVVFEIADTCFVSKTM